MRWVFYSLLVLNIVYFSWEMLSPGEKKVAQTSNVFSVVTEPVQLLEERDARTFKGAGSEAKVLLCVAIGPLRGGSTAKSLVQDVSALGYSPRLIEVEVGRGDLNWVYLPPGDTVEDGLKLLRDLQEKGVESFIVSSGEYENAISLGYFAGEHSALGLKEKMRTAGYDAQVKKVDKTVSESWVYIRSGEIKDGGGALRDLMSALGDSGIHLKNIECSLEFNIEHEPSLPSTNDEILNGNEDEAQQRSI